jgi:hypothetical protein
MEVGTIQIQVAATSDDWMEDGHEPIQVEVIDHAKGRTDRPMGDREQIREADDDRGGTLDVEKGRRQVPVALEKGIQTQVAVDSRRSQMAVTDHSK